MLFCIRVHRTESCERSSPPGRRRRTARWKFEAVARIVRLLDTIKAPGSPGHLSRPSDEGKVVEPTDVKARKNEPVSATASRKRSLRRVGNH